MIHQTIFLVIVALFFISYYYSFFIKVNQPIENYTNLITPSYSSQQSLRIMQYNILSQQLSQSHVYVEKKYLNINYRFNLLCDIIKQSNCDIICLQEVDGTKTFQIKNPMHIGQKIAIYGQKLGYQYSYYRKNTQNEIDLGNMILYKKKSFHLIQQFYLHYPNQKQFAIILHLQYKLSQLSDIVVICTHISCDYDKPEIQLQQVRTLVEYCQTNYSNHPIIICGDFNAQPNTLVYNYMIQSFHSAYYQQWNQEPIATNINPPFIGCLDYIFFTPRKIHLQSIEEITIPSQIKTFGIPNKYYPSDHLPLIANFGFI